MSEPALLASKTITIRTVGPPHDTMPPICYEVPYMPASARFRDDRFRFIRHRCLNYYFKTTVTLFERGRYINIRELSGPSWRAVGASIAALESL
jgi:hypothetical protein